MRYEKNQNNFHGTKVYNLGFWEAENDSTSARQTHTGFVTGTGKKI